MKQEAPRPRPRRAGTTGGRISQEHVNDFTFDAPTVIRTKRDGGVLSDAAIDWVIDG
ncbi:MAG: thymidine phosphorylase, partial [Pseudonocardiales bacterium]|nr:thymidine phosphorylase [Pseudonocardiales bacterium]